MSCKNISCQLVFLVFSMLPLIAGAQSKRLYDERQGFRRCMVDFRNGNLPYRDNDKWGFANRYNTVVVEAQYDSLLPGGTGYCIAVKKGAYFLVGEDLETVLPGPMVEIRHIPGTTPCFYTKNKAGETGFYKVLPDHSLVYFGTAQALQLYEHNDYSHAVDSRLVDALIFSGDVSGFHCYYKDGTEQVLLPVSGHQLDFYPPYYIADSYAKGSSERYRPEGKYLQLVNLETMDTIKVAGDMTEAFKKNGETFLLFQGENPGSGQSVLNDSGDTVFTSRYQLEYVHDFLVESYTVRGENKYNLLTFPGLQMIEKEQNGYIRGEGYLTVYSKKHCRTYAPDGTLFYTGRYRGLVPGASGEASKLFVVKEKKNTRVITCTGKVLFKTKDREVRAYEEYQSPYTVLTFFGSKDEQRFRGIYDARADTLVLLDYSEVRFIGNDKFIACYDNDEQTACDIIYANGICANDSVYGELEVTRSGSFRAVSEYPANGGELKIYNADMRLIAEGWKLDVVLSEHAGEVNLLTFKTGKKQDTYGVIDAHFNVLLPDKYKGIYLHVPGGYFVVWDENNKLGYVRMDGTELFR